MKTEPKPEPIEEPELKVEIKDMSNFVLVAAYARGLDNREFDSIKVHYLWDGNYRINCSRANRIVNSYFIRYSNDEGVLWSEPHLPLAKEAL